MDNNSKTQETAVSQDTTILENKSSKEETSSSPISIKEIFKTKKGRTRFLTRVAMFSAIATVFYCYLKFSLPFFPSFLEVKFHNLFIIIGSLLTGPIGGVIITVVMVLLKLILIGTNGAAPFVGELFDLLLSTLVMLPSSLMYMKNHTKKGGEIGILLSFISWVIFSFLINWFITLPLYLRLYGAETVLNMLKVTLPKINQDNLMSIYLFGAVLPFNSLVAFVNCGTAFLVYKKISLVLKKMGV